MFKSGYYTIVGKPNVGKSTLLNTLIGEKIAIVSWRPQTTRNKIIGVMHGEDYQVVFIDTPGIHSAKNKLGEYMMKSVRTSLDGVDGVLYVIAADKGVDDKDLSFIEKYAKQVPTIVAINKVDAVERERVFRIMERVGALKLDVEIIPISAQKNKNIDTLKNEIVERLNEGEMFYPEDMITDKSLRFMVGEIIREKAMKLLSDEVPYGIGVVVNKYTEREDGILDIDADIICEKDAHKAMIIGKQGSMIKQIGINSRCEIQNLVECQVNLTLYVRVKEDWRDSDYLVEELGYIKKEV